MSTKCKIRGCSWTGDVSKLFKHCDKEHHNFVVDICDDTHFNLKFDEISTNTYLLCGKEGLYWFCVNTRLRQKDRMERGIFAIDDSEICQYRILIGSASRGPLAAQGPFPTAPLGSNQYHIEWSSRQLMSYHQLKLNCLRIVFLAPGQSMEFENLYDSTLASSERAIYPCKICSKDVEADGSICINRHCLCGTCLWDSEQWFGISLCSICVAESRTIECDEEDEEAESTDSDDMIKAVKLRAAIKIKCMLNHRKEMKVEKAKMELKAEKKKRKKEKKREKKRKQKEEARLQEEERLRQEAKLQEEVSQSPPIGLPSI